MLPVTGSNPFKWRHYRGDIILWCVRWYLRYPISLVHMSEMAAEGGLAISASCIWRWVQVFGSGNGPALSYAPAKDKPKLAAG